MGVIATELKNFKTQVEPALDGMSVTSTKIAEGVELLSSYSSSVQSGVSSNYNSTNKATILSNLDRVNEVYSKIATTVENDLNSFISDSENLINLITQLENINEDIKAQQEIINNNSGEDASAIDARTKAQEIVTEKNNSFIEINDLALKAYNALKSKGGDVSFCQEFSTSNYENLRDSLEYGTFELKKFTSSNGTTIEYYIYVPDYGTEVENLPCMLYMHGGEQVGNNYQWDDYGLTSLIANRDVTPAGIVIMPHITNFNDLQTIKELTDYVVSEYNCDTDKISVGGHSSGAIATYRMINTYPDYFSCAVPISGCNYGSITEEAFGGLEMWAFGGSGEGGSSATSTSVGQGAVRKVNNVGGNAKFTVLPGGHSDTNANTFAEKYTSPDGTEMYVLDWMFAQTKA